jgi:5-methylcytosine-specific restriction endonuclease McrA
METKTCTTCLQTLPLTAFYRSKNGQSRGATCRQCEAARIKEWRKTPSGAASALRATRKYNASPAGKTKKESYRGSEARVASRRKYEASEKGKAVAARFRQTEKCRVNHLRYYHESRGKEAQRLWHQTPKGRECLLRGVHKRRSLLVNQSTLSAQDWQTIQAAYGHACAYCGQTGLALTRDHILPLSMGGQHVRENIRPACRSCNSKKNNRHLEPAIHVTISF